MELLQLHTKTEPYHHEVGRAMRNPRRKHPKHFAPPFGYHIKLGHESSFADELLINGYRLFSLGGEFKNFVRKTAKQVILPSYCRPPTAVLQQSYEIASNEHEH